MFVWIRLLPDLVHVAAWIRLRQLQLWARGDVARQAAAPPPPPPPPPSGSEARRATTLNSLPQRATSKRGDGSRTNDARVLLLLRWVFGRNVKSSVREQRFTKALKRTTARPMVSSRVSVHERRFASAGCHVLLCSGLRCCVICAALGRQINYFMYGLYCHLNNLRFRQKRNTSMLFQLHV